MWDQMVRKACVGAVNKEVADSGKPAPEGMQTFTCDCVVQQMKKRQSIEVAKTTCKNQAAAKYQL
jgi:cobalamin biosynthesis Co2+ chelatase CbiK